MRLEMGSFKIKHIQFSSKTCLNNGVLEINREELAAALLEDKTFSEAGIEIVVPGEKTRIVHVIDAVEPRFKEGDTLPYAGVDSSVGQLGRGTTYRMEGVAVLTSCQFPLTRHGGLNIVRDSVLDMVGPAGPLTPFSSLINVVCSLKLRPGMDEDQYEQSVRTAGIRAARYLGQVLKGQVPDSMTSYSLEGAKAGLPNVAYLYQVHSVGLNLSSFLYNLRFDNLLPVIVHPNEILDGAVVDGNWSHPNVKTPTWFHTNNPLIRELYQRHGKSLNFVGVVFFRGRFEEMEGKKRCAQRVAASAQLLKADGVVASWEGDGNAFMETMLSLKACEKRGIKTAIMTFEHGGAEGVDEPLFYSEPEVDAIISLGSWDPPITLPPVDRVVGGDTLRIRPEQGGIDLPAKDEIKLVDRLEVFTAANEFGFSKLSCEEF
ncbi:glycine/sarcosine/betaine reductase component B alpha/beta subunit [Desulfosporosinus orientis DSM 765]|uniref:Glycine/sarcosine/betaine reductase component B alpha/beta subunit n=1 Tax=Desulfosporosinus orientis (strain ATCC 19365 / DSM 765 / NCIMB 8382 / VKM B-1628 / Singapore I) TaxID=768706 RepID=G7WD07_DESOD|nr:glycine/sarcosine/betaine reductase component B subunit [Desulfosporosinus orientis]AET67202.1 glycine/sarcosine/betaine reductase component B alpha/beta subunit [Desulfosporosinus orientis DSM 765]